MTPWTRKDFLKASLLTGGAALLAPRRAVAATASGSPNGDVRLAIVGCGGKGMGHIRAFGKIPGARIVALCEPDSTRLAAAVQRCDEELNLKVRTYRDYRKLLEDDSIDAVVIVTPNHWHSLMTVWGCQAGKDVYVEKPISHNVWEGRKAVEAARKYKRIVQAGTQSRSDEALHEAFTYLRDGHLGRIQWARGLCYKRRESIGQVPGPQPMPSEIDYDLWLGPARLEPLRRERLHYDWHWFWETGNGDIGNQGVHEMDMCRWALGQDGLPPAVTSFGGRYGYEDDGETPNTQIAVLDYQPAPLIFEVRGLPRSADERAMDAYRGIRTGITIQCEHGHFAGGSGGGFVYDAEGKRVKGFTSAGGGGHPANFIDAVRTRKAGTLNADIELGHVSSACCHVANVSYRLGQCRPADAATWDEPAREAHGRMLDHLRANDISRDVPLVVGPWLQKAPGKETFVTKEEYDVGYWANRLLRRDYRPPYIVPERV